jgi:threonyl-tRNA synthetase
LRANIVVVGEREVADRRVTLRRRGIDEQISLPIDAFEQRLLETIRLRSRVFLLV